MRISVVFQKFFFIIMLSTFCITNNIATVHSQCLEDQKSLLLEFKKSIKFKPLDSTKLVQWNQTKDCCSWNGVECDASGHVIGLQLDDDTIYGDIENSTTLFSLGYLEKLNLAFNSFFNNRIPRGLYNLTNLTHLNLSNAGFVGQIPVELGRMRSLVSLDLSQIFGLKLENPNLNILIQNLTGLRELVLDGVNISARGSEWGQVLSSSLPSLRYLSLRYCNLSGPIDFTLSQLRSLLVLRLDGNNLSTTVPDFFGNYSGLTTLTLHACSLRGYFPERIFQLPSLQNLDLSSNSLLSGTIPEFSKGGSLRTIILAYTNFSSSVPHSISSLVMLSMIDLNSCHFSGPIPSTISDMPELVHLDFSFNTFTGFLPSFHKSKKLTHVDLRHNSLIGSLFSTHFIGLPSLVYLNLRKNSFNGSIPQALFLLPSLQELDLSNNQFSGQVKEFSTPLYSSNLEILDLSSNELQGSIPKSFFKLKKLTDLVLSFNFFNGTIHLENFRELPDISTLEIGDNNLSVVTRRRGNSSSSFSLFSQLSGLDLTSCNLYDFPDLRNHSALEYLDLSNNQIRGKIPSWVWEIGNGRIFYLNLSCNFLDHLEKPYNISHSIYYLDLHSNQLHGELHLPTASATYSDYSSNNFRSIPLNIGYFTSTAVFFSLANNNLIGSIPTSFCNAINFEILDLSGNNLNGSIAPCLIGNNLDLRVLNLGRNNISGDIPDAFSVNCILQTLDLSTNNLGGKIPASLANCKSLQVVNVGNNKMDDSFPCILKTLPSLRVLVLRSNRFHGIIKCPGVNQSWPNLQIIDVASNFFNGYLNPRFFSSWRVTTPEELGHYHLPVKVLTPNKYIYYQDKVTVTMKGLEMKLVKILSVFTTFDFSCNNFHGKIPNTIGDLRSLHALNLSHNAFTGTIPASIGNLTQLESLDLSSNLLSGKIPMEMASLTFLSALNLSFNKLSGMIPTGPQLQTFSPASYEGNVELCGFPLNVSCNGPGADSPPKLETRHLYPTADINWDYVSAALGYIVGLGTTVCFLLYCNNWRQIYFEKVDQVFSKIFNLQDGRKRRGGRKRVSRNQVRRQ